MIGAPSLFLPFLVTVLVEGFLVAVFLWRLGAHAKILIFVVLVHCLTHPLGAALYYFTPLTLYFVECAVTLLEALAYRSLLVRSWFIAFGISVIANAASFYLGPVIRVALGT